MSVNERAKCSVKSSVLESPKGTGQKQIRFEIVVKWPTLWGLEGFEWQHDERSPLKRRAIFQEFRKVSCESTIASRRTR